MSTAYRRLRKQMPWLTPTYAGDDEQQADMFDRLRLPRRSMEVRTGELEGFAGDEQADLLNRLRLPRIPLVDDDEAIPALTRPPLTVMPPSEPEFGDNLGTVPTLARSLHPIDRIAVLGEGLPMPESDIPLLSRQLQVPHPRTVPTVTYDQGGRPTSRVFGTDDPEQRVLARRRALESYEPQKESKKSLALRTILNFVGGGIPGAAQTLIGPGGVLDRRGKDRMWQQQQLGQVDAQYGRMRADRRSGLQDRLLESQVMENEAQAQRALRPPPVPPPKPTNIFDNAQDVEDEAGNVIMVGPDGKPIINPATGEPYVRRRLKAPAVKPDTSEFTNEQISRTIGEIEAEQRTLGPSPPTQIDDVNQWGEVVGKKVNPAYLDWSKRYRELDDQKRQLQMKRKPSAPSLTRGDDAIEQRLRDEAKRKNLDPEKAVQRYREGKRAGRF